MSHLLAISVGPVQEFIAAARRTRDLWFGSRLLSEISREVARAVGGNLIFPANSDAENVANVILVELPNGDPSAIACKAKKAAKRRWKDFADETFQQASSVIRTEIWNDQVDDVIEFYAAWVTRSEDYRADRSKVMRLLAGRKNCRDFAHAKGRAGVPKSSLDGQRESALKTPSDWPSRFRSHLRIREGEQLDVVGLVKRVAGGTQSYPSVARIAADPWVRGNRSRLGPVVEACKSLNGVIRELHSSFNQYRDFPYEGTAVFPSRYHELAQETELSDTDLKPLRAAQRNLPEVSPYLAVLVADGDRMGEVISRLDSPHKHRAFSTALAGFADEGRRIITKQSGVLVYAGGDDVLAFLPVDKSLECARELHNKFGDMLQQYKNEEGKRPTLSVGIAIGHFMENLEDLLEYGRTAERAAKKVEGKDALAVHLHKRGGSPIEIAARWDDKPDERLDKFANLMNQGIIPTKLPYELREMSQLYEGESWREHVNAAIQQDVLRLIAKKSSRGEETVGKVMSEYLKDMNAAKLLTLAKELLAARLIADAKKQAGGEA